MGVGKGVILYNDTFVWIGQEKKRKRTRLAGHIITLFHGDKALPAETLIFRRIADGIPDDSVAETGCLFVAGSCKNQMLIITNCEW